MNFSMFSFVVQKYKSVHKLKGDKSRLEAEVEELEKKVERMSTMRTQVGDRKNIDFTIKITLIYIFNLP